MPRTYRVPMRITYDADVLVEAATPALAKLKAAQGGWDSEQLHLIHSWSEVAGAAEEVKPRRR